MGDWYSAEQAVQNSECQCFIFTFADQELGVLCITVNDPGLPCVTGTPQGQWHESSMLSSVFMSEVCSLQILLLS